MCVNEFVSMFCIQNTETTRADSSTVTTRWRESEGWTAKNRFHNKLIFPTHHHPFSTHSGSDALISLHQLVGDAAETASVAICTLFAPPPPPTTIVSQVQRRRMLLVNKEASELMGKDDFALCVPGSPRIKFNVEDFVFHYEFMVGASMFVEVWEGGFQLVWVCSL